MTPSYSVFSSFVNQIVPPCAEWWVEIVIGATTFFGYCPSTVFSLFSHIARMPKETDAKKILTAAPLENWRRPPGCPRTTWMKSIQQDLKSIKLSLNEQLTWFRIIHSGDWCLHLALCTPPSGAFQKWRRSTFVNLIVISKTNFADR